MNRPWSDGCSFYWIPTPGGWNLGSVERCVVLRWRDVVAVSVEAVFVEPVHLVLQP